VGVIGDSAVLGEEEIGGQFFFMGCMGENGPWRSCPAP
jgi:hypothetical protein